MLFEERGQKITVLKTAIPGAMSITGETLHVIQFLLTQSEKLSIFDRLHRMRLSTFPSNCGFENRKPQFLISVIRLAGRWPRNADIEIAVFKTVFKTAIFDICEQLVVSSYSEEHERRHQTMIAVLKTVFKSVISMSAFL